MELVHATIVQDECPECRNALLEEAKSLGGLALAGDVVIIPKHWLSTVCPHGRSGLRFALAESDGRELSPDAERMQCDKVKFVASDSRFDASKNIGYPVREHGPYGSHPMHDDFDDESGPDGPGAY